MSALLGVLVNIIIVIIVNIFLTKSYHLNVLICIILFIFLQYVLSRIFNFLCRDYVSGDNPKHLIVLQHGYSCHYSRLYSMSKFYKSLHNLHCNENQNMSNTHEKNKNSQSSLLHDESSNIVIDNNREEIVVHIARCNSDGWTMGFWQTNDGIDKGGERLGKEIVELLKQYPTIEKLSLIGGSLGGLYIRHALKYIYNTSNHTFISNVKPMNFITLAAPHLGIDDWLQNLEYNCSYCCNLYSTAKKLDQFHILTPTVKQLLRLDVQNFERNESYLLYKMANEIEYIEPLSKFQNIVNYACVDHDKRVSSHSAAILPLRFDSSQYWDCMLSNSKNYLFSTIDSAQYTIIKQTFYSGNMNSEKIHTDVFLGNDENVNEHKEAMTNVDITTKNEENYEQHSDFIDVSKTSQRQLLFEYSNQWFCTLANDIPWKRVMVCLNQSIWMRKYCHTFITIPVMSMKHCKPIFERFSCDFVW